MGFVSFFGTIREGSNGQMIITVPAKFRKVVSVNKLVFVKISNEKKDLEGIEEVKYD